MGSLRSMATHLRPGKREPKGRFWRGHFGDAFCQIQEWGQEHILEVWVIRHAPKWL